MWTLSEDCTVYLFLLLEFQSTLDRRMPLRFVRYITAFYEAYIDEHPGVETLPAVFPLLLYNGEDRWSVPSRIEEMIEPTLPERFVPRLSYYPIIINAIPKDRLERIKNAVSAVFYVENSDPESVDRVESTREVKAMFGTKLKQYGERVAQEAAERARKEGREEGRERGREEGREVEREEIALRMLDQGRSVEEIAEITGLLKERIAGLRK